MSQQLTEKQVWQLRRIASLYEKVAPVIRQRTYVLPAPVWGGAPAPGKPKPPAPLRVNAWYTLEAPK
jgi:hypothetical protein